MNNDIKYNSRVFAKCFTRETIDSEGNSKYELVFAAPSGKQVIQQFDTEAEMEEAYASAEIGGGGISPKILAEYVKKEELIEDLKAYYLKTETYSKTEVNNLINAIERAVIRKVNELPQSGESNVIYLVPAQDGKTGDEFDEYVWTDNKFEKIGSTRISLDGYATEQYVNDAISGIIIPSALADLSDDANHRLVTDDEKTTWSGKQNAIDSSHKLSSDLVDDTNKTNKFVTAEEKTAWSGKQDALTAGTNIDITNDVISSTIPYLNDSNGVSVAPEGTIGGYFGNATGFGKGIRLSNSGATAFGYQAYANTDSISIGRNTGSASTKNAISIGSGAVADQYEARFGSSTSNTNKITIYTSNGVKELATQEYVDNKIPQVSTMPTANASNLGKICQFIGTTTIDYTNGYFYKCVSDEEQEPTYSWEQVNVQDGATYTAGTNVSIDANNTINCTVPYSAPQNSGSIILSKRSNVSIGYNSVAVGSDVGSSVGTQTVAIGDSLNASGSTSIAIGSSADCTNTGSIVIGFDAASTKNNQAVFGSSMANINEVGIYTSNGYKELATEEYADSKASQVSTMPTANANNLDKIVQYIGASVANSYTNGYFYKCVSDGASTPTYSWEEIEVQASSGSTYTAGTNIDITNNVISNTIPYKDKSYTEGNRGFGVATLVRQPVGNDGCYLGSNISSYNYSYGDLGTGTYIGNGIKASGNYNIAIGNNAQTNHQMAIALGDNAATTKNRQMMIGGDMREIDEIALYTRYGVKTIATEDYVTQRAYELAGLSAYDNTATYDEGDYVYNGLLIYKCNTTISTAEDWTAAHWTQKTYLEYLRDTLYTDGDNVAF